MKIDEELKVKMVAAALEQLDRTGWDRVLSVPTKARRAAVRGLLELVYVTGLERGYDLGWHVFGDGWDEPVSAGVDDDDDSVPPEE